ncbi:hypothetical protein ACIBG8_42920 [Nonomuraea sp. NPDC050556]|uniref:T4 family baseplate hub assembly chaperone n=1 Tax=Nonomuraea sp. NPDC050556 TaxID=3364369 RepID=UPI0037ADE7BE
MMTISGQVTVLPGGYADGRGRIHREAEVIAMTGRDEELLADGSGSAVLVTALLSRCVRRIGTITPVTPEVARGLLVADRQFLLLKVREATFGTAVRSSIACPRPECGRRIDVEFDTADIPVVESADKGPQFPMTLDTQDGLRADGGTHRELVFRLPHGGDQEALSAVLQKNDAAALTALLERCILRIGPFEPAPPELVARLSPRARLAVERRMAELAPQLDLTMESTCPECGHGYSVPFEIQSFLFGELRVNAGLLRGELHYLAYHYHWSEQEIMDMPRERRRRYVAMLTDEIERSHADL